eukprot:m.170283 g.170283  ORF g.170283 m.170283 type:complete len:1125 (+) comp39035_c0_seq17:25-3399(+)
MSWELSKENIKPLRSGRRIDMLSAGLSRRNAHEEEIFETRQRFEDELVDYYENGPKDPLALETWLRYVEWTEQAFPQGNSQSSRLEQLLVRCIKGYMELEPVPDTLKNSHVFLKISLRYVEIYGNPLQLFNYFESNGFFQTLALFYEAWTTILEKQKKFKEAEEVYRLGLNRSAQPLKRLQLHNFEFMQRMSVREECNEKEERQSVREPLGGLRMKKMTGEVSMTRTGQARSALTGGLGSRQTGRTVEKGSLRIHFDAGTDVSNLQKIEPIQNFPDMEKSQAENRMKAGRWGEAKLQKSQFEVPPARATFCVHQDEEAGVFMQKRLLPPGTRVLKDKAIHKVPDNPLSNKNFYNPSFGYTHLSYELPPKMKLGYNHRLFYPDGRGVDFQPDGVDFLSFEELRAQLPKHKAEQSRGDDIELTCVTLPPPKSVEEPEEVSVPVPVPSEDPTVTRKLEFETPKSGLAERRLAVVHSERQRPSSPAAPTPTLMTRIATAKIDAFFNQTLTPDGESFHRETASNGREERKDVVPFDVYEDPGSCKQRKTTVALADRDTKENKRVFGNSMKEGSSFVCPLSSDLEKAKSEPKRKLLTSRSILSTTKPADVSRKSTAEHSHPNNGNQSLATDHHLKADDNDDGNSMVKDSRQYQQVKASTPHDEHHHPLSWTLTMVGPSNAEEWADPSPFVSNSKRSIQLKSLQTNPLLTPITEESGSTASGRTRSSHSSNASSKMSTAAMSDHLSSATLMPPSSHLSSTLKIMESCETTTLNPFSQKFYDTMVSEVSLAQNKKFSLRSSTLPLAKGKQNRGVQFGLQLDTYCRVDELIATGGYASVYLATELRDDDDDASVKKQKAVKCQMPPHLYELYITEIIQDRLACKGSLPNLSRCMTNFDMMCVYNDGSLLVADYHSRGTLLDVINYYQSKGETTESEAMYLTTEMIRLVEAIHEIGILHCDIKPDNFLVTLDDRAVDWSPHYCRDGSQGWAGHALKMIDFGCAIDTTLLPPNTTFKTERTPADFQCIEMREGKPWRKQLDYYGLVSTTSCLIHLNYLAPHQIYKKCGRWTVNKKVKRSWTSVWSEMFDEFLNIPSCDDSDMPSLKEYRERMEEQLQRYHGLFSNIKALVASMRR